MLMLMVSLLCMWAAFLLLLGWFRASRRRKPTVWYTRGTVGCTLLFLLTAFLWSYLFR